MQSEAMATGDPTFSCTLPAAGYAERARMWQEMASLVVHREHVENGFRIVFDRSALEVLTALVAAERSCCGWASWSLCSDDSTATLEVSGPSEPIAALAAAFGL